MVPSRMYLCIYNVLLHWISYCSVGYDRYVFFFLCQLLFIFFFQKKFIEFSIFFSSGELYPQKVRGIMGGMTTFAAHTFVFIVVKTYPYLSHVLEKHGTFILYGSISLVG